MSLYRTIRISEIREEVSQFKLFIFEEGHGLFYKAGQYLTLVRLLGKEEIRRSYSIVSSPLLEEPLSIGVKRIENGFFSRELFDRAKPGDLLETTGVGGLFTLPADINSFDQLFFFAAGSGITPVYSLLRTALHAYPRINTVLVYSNSSPGSTIFLEPLKTLQTQFGDRLKLQLLFSNSENLSHARLHRLYLFELLDRFLAKSRRTVFYVCGPEAYMRMCIYSLQEWGIPSSLIRKENFLIPSHHSFVQPPDKNSYVAGIWYGGQRHDVTVTYPDTILRAAKKSGLVLPYSCEAGRCGNCVALCKKGRVWHAYNEVLTEKELSEGFILTCTAHPQGGNVELEIH
ncbi:MAG TPA: ferredoxin--NADP reductase [Flavisolibacter sp.]|nr:ferredoxin--NADP reductase [Flavisolibacter sp.]